MNRRVFACLALVAITGALSLAREAQGAGKSPVPDEAAQKEARKRVYETYGKDICDAKTSEAQADLAKKLLQAGKNQKSDPAVRYALLGLAADGVEVDTTLAAVGELAASFDVDVLKWKANSLARLEKVRGPDESALADQAARLIDEALAADRYDVARQAAELAVALAKKNGDRAVIQAATARQQEVAALEAGYEPVRKALAALTANPNNTAAYLTLGRFYCLVKGDWDKGLPMLASSSDKTLKALAQKEAGNPAAADDQVDLADGWWDLAQKEQGSARQRMTLHAADWYKKALPEVSGLMKAKVAKRLAALADAPEEKAAAAAPKAVEIAIIKATYGPPGKPAQQLDVTARLQKALARDGFVLVQPDNRVMTDPAFLRAKRLIVDCRCGSNRVKLDLGEGEVAVLPPMPFGGLRLAGASKDLTIVAARYGGGMTWLDVTSQVAAAVTDPAEPFAWENFGANSDRWPDGQKRHLAIWFDYRESRYVRIFASGETHSLLP